MHSTLNFYSPSRYIEELVCTINTSSFQQVEIGGSSALL
jgi:hypothetical protein